jgi:predicted nucleic acid-binding protein
MRYLDASVPLCVMTKEPKKYYGRCVEIMNKIEQGKESAVASVFTIAEIGYILERREGLAGEKLNEMLLSLLDCLGLKLLDVEAIVCREALELRSEYRIDFVDAYNVLTMRRNGIKEIYSLDEHYDAFTDIKRRI